MTEKRSDRHHRHKHGMRAFWQESFLNKGIVIGTSIVIVLIIFCVGIVLNQPTSNDMANGVSTSSLSQKKKSSSTKPEVEDSSSVNSSRNSSMPTDGTTKKILQFNTVDEAEAAIKDHEATCQYRDEHFYPGLVYTGTYRCPCGTTITWWDQKLKDGFDDGDSDDPRVRSIMGLDIDENSSQNSEDELWEN